LPNKVGSTKTATKVESSSDLKGLPNERLVAWIRELRRERYLSLNDIDPPPYEWWELEGWQL
jgi:hypothetical protein